MKLRQMEARMKLHKAVTADFLENVTRDGWQVEGEPRVEKRFVELRYQFHPTEEQRRAGMYDQQRTKHEFGDVLVFVVWKDSEAASREAELQAQLAEAGVLASSQAVEIKNFNKRLNAEVEINDALKRDLTRLNGIAERDLRTQEALREKNRMLESDLAKVRTAIGELQWKEFTK